MLFFSFLSLFFLFLPIISPSEYVFQEDIYVSNITVQRIEEFYEEKQDGLKEHFLEISGEDNKIYVYLDYFFNYALVKNRVQVGDKLEVSFHKDDYKNTTLDGLEVYYFVGLKRGGENIVSPGQNYGSQLYGIFDSFIWIFIFLFFFIGGLFHIKEFLSKLSHIDTNYYRRGFSEDYIVFQDLLCCNSDLSSTDIQNLLPSFFYGFIILWLIQNDIIREHGKFNTTEDLMDMIENGEVSFTELVYSFEGFLYASDFLDTTYIEFIQLFISNLQNKIGKGNYKSTDNWELYKEFEKIIDSALEKYIETV